MYIYSEKYAEEVTSSWWFEQEFVMMLMILNILKILMGMQYFTSAPAATNAVASNW